MFKFQVPTGDRKIVYIILEHVTSVEVDSSIAFVSMVNGDGYQIDMADVERLVGRLDAHNTQRHAITTYSGDQF